MSRMRYYISTCRKKKTNVLLVQKAVFSVLSTWKKSKTNTTYIIFREIEKRWCNWGFIFFVKTWTDRYLFWNKTQRYFLLTLFSYRLIILWKFLFVQHFIKKCRRLTKTFFKKSKKILHCQVKFPFQYFDRMVNKRDFLNIINLYSVLQFILLCPSIKNLAIIAISTPHIFLIFTFFWRLHVTPLFTVYISGQ